MAGTSTPQRYDTFAIAFHWAIAVALLVTLSLGFLAAHASAPGSRQAASLLRIHVPLGILILLLTVARGIWRVRHVRPPAPFGQPRWQLGVARVTHMLLYVMPFATAASGLALLAASGVAPIVFSRLPGALPDLTRFPPMTVHALGAGALVGLVCIHVIAVIYHQFIRRDRLLARMGIGMLSKIIRQ